MLENGAPWASDVLFRDLVDLKQTCIFTGAQPKAGTGLKMQTVRFFNVTLLGIYR